LCPARTIIQCIGKIGRYGAHRAVQEQLQHHALHHALQRPVFTRFPRFDRDEPDRARQQDVQRRPARRLFSTSIVLRLWICAARFDQLQWIIEIIHCNWSNRPTSVSTPVERAHQDHDARAEEADDAVLDGVEGAVVSGTHARAPDALYLSKRARGGRDDDRDRSIHVPLTGRLVEPAGEARSTRV